MRAASVFVEAIPLRYDYAAWERVFLELWPEGSAAHRSYYKRITGGPSYDLVQAVREEEKWAPASAGATI
ncbi:MAG TPA: hypothetical protein VFC18_04190 [Burkholderiales bacterium]|nr:hypothetical protein [Burkholderiales bacterium]